MPKILLGLIAVAIVVVVFATTMGDKTPAPNRETSDTAACDVAQQIVKQQIKVKATAKFAPCHAPDTTVEHRGPVRIVRSWVEAQNALGVMVIDDMIVEMSYDYGDQRWEIRDVQTKARLK